MKKDKTGQSDKADLRSRAEERIKAKKIAVELTDSRTKKSINDLQIYQIELEMQNEELLRSRNVTDALMADYLDIYDFAPIGYFTLNTDGVIMQGNLTGASLLGVERSSLAGQQLQFRFSDESYSVFDTFLKKTFEGEAIESCEVKLFNGVTLTAFCPA